MGDCGVRAPTIGVQKNWQRRICPDELADSEFVRRVMARWHDGCDTAQIAIELFERESVVAWALRIGREREREGGT